MKRIFRKEILKSLIDSGYTEDEIWFLENDIVEDLNNIWGNIPTIKIEKKVGKNNDTYFKKELIKIFDEILLDYANYLKNPPTIDVCESKHEKWLLNTKLWGRDIITTNKENENEKSV